LFGLTELLDFVDPHSSFDVHTFTQNGWLDENGLCFTICKLHIHLCTVLKVINPGGVVPTHYLYEVAWGIS
jgi:hypothetical protein